MPVRKLTTVCFDLLKLHAHRLTDVGDATFGLLRELLLLPVITAEQLKELEANSPHLYPDSEEVWRELCIKDFVAVRIEVEDGRMKKPPTTWRELHCEQEIKKQERMAAATAKMRGQYRDAQAGRATIKQMALSLSLDEALALLVPSASHTPEGNCLPISASLPGDILTPVVAYLRLTNGGRSGESFLLESVVRGETAGRWSYVGAKPQKVFRSGENQPLKGDPLVPLEKELENYKFIRVHGAPPFTGGAIGYVSYDCVQYFEPKTARPLSDPVGMPESVFLLADTLVAFDHLFQTVRVVSHVFLPSSTSSDDAVKVATDSYNEAKAKIADLIALLTSNEPLPLPEQPKIVRPPKEAVSNVGEVGYKGFVTSLKKNIVLGDIIQAVPSQRLTRETALHPFNVYRHLRQLNPSPYMFYIDCGEGVRLVGASPECLCKVEKNVVTNHAIAGTIKRGKTAEEDEKLAEVLRNSLKDRAEHVMLVDLARNDVNRVCQPATVKVDSLMQVEKFSHVMHLTSQVSGVLREGLTRFDAFRSIFPAGTVSGAPKIRAIELVADLEKERRGAYAGAVGHFDFAGDSMDTCIAIRTMTFKDGRAYLQAGGGIVFDSDEQEEYIETINKLGANVKCLEDAEVYYSSLESKE
ncbi:anthranilate synthase component I [Pseudohyphozyma bogoriensis]|nr:anthranilate synthase component I [Pseudohyphozyma bogoriensis]